MKYFISKLDKTSDTYQRNAQKMQQHVDQMHQELSTIINGNSKKNNLNKLSPRQRLAELLDEPDDFLEFSQFAAYKTYQEDVPCAGIITGIGKISNTECVIIINDPLVKGGTYFPLTVKKHLRAQEIALENNLPCIYLVDSGGAFLPKQDEVFPDKEHFGRIFYNQAQMSANNIPQIAVVFGSCTAGGAYIPAMSDQTIMVKQQATIFLGGPPLVKAATGEIVNQEELGGADIHCRFSGVADYMANDDLDAINITKEIVNNLNRHKCHSIIQEAVKPPKLDINELYGVIPSDPRLSFDIREIIYRIIDDSHFEEFKQLFGKSLVCGFAKLSGYQVGIIANNGILFSESAQKGTHFIQLCCKRKIPLIFLQNINGFMVGKKYEEGGIAKHGAKMVAAVSCAQVPKFTVIIGGSFGAGNYAMSGRAFNSRMIWMWPNAKISVMGGEQAANVMATIAQMKHEKNNTRLNEEEIETIKQPILTQYQQQSSAYYASARLWDDGIIDPKETRTVLTKGLSAAANQPIPDSVFSVFRM